ncbi:MAG: FAD-dependent oxidoreductase, partial [Thermodesulfobacteriota bacterium]
VNIHAFERWLGDYGIRHGLRHRKVSEEMRAERVAVIGAGPAGLSCAFQLARHGYPVTVFEANAQAGGMLRYGIPAYKLPRAVLDAEIGAIKEMGVEIVCQSVIGQERGLADLKEEFSAIFIGIGAHGALKLGLAGEECANVISGARFLRLVHGGSLPEVGRQVLVVGGGDSSISAARVARRLGAEVTIVYRRSRAEMPAIEQEITAAEAEGVEILYLVAPLALEVEEGRVVAVECQRMELGAPDASGRRQPLAIVGATFRKECTMLIPAIGQRPQWRDVQPYVGEANWLQPDDDMALADNIYSGGDTLGLRLVTNAIGEGRRAAEGIMARLQGETGRGQVREQPVVGPGQLRLEYYERREPNRGACLPVDQRLAGGLDLELDRGLSQEQFQAEAQRCMSCGLCFECRQCLIFCPQLAISEDPQRPIGEVMSTDYNRCVGCHICAQSCPCAFIQMGMGEGL